MNKKNFKTKTKIKFNRNNGITIITLAVSIIVLLILAAISVAAFNADNGFLVKSREARIQTDKDKEREQISLSTSAAQISNYGHEELTHENLQSSLNNHLGVGKATVTDNSDGTFSVTMNNPPNRTYNIVNGKVYDSIYIVTFRGYNNKLIETQQVEYGKSATAPTPATYYGLRFTGWDKDFSNVTKNLTITAKYESNTQMTINVKDGYINGNTSLTTSVIPYGTAFYVEPTNKTNFIGWSIDNGKTLISNREKFQFTSCINCTLTPVYSQTPVTKENLVTSISFRYMHEEASGKQVVQMITLGDAIENYDLVEIGVVFSFSDSAILTLEKVDSSNVYSKKSSVVTEASPYGLFSYVYTLNLGAATTASKTIYFKGYIKYKNRSTGEISTKYTTNTLVEKPAI